jgi:hypothetical protein
MTSKSDYFLIGQKSFFTETTGDKAKVIRSSVGKEITQLEKDIAGDYYNSTTDTIEYAEIYNLDFGPNFLTQLGASDEWMSTALTEKAYKDAFKKATNKTGPNVDFLTGGDIANKLWNSSPINTNANGKSTTKSVSGLLYYPLNRDKKNYDYLKITACEYKPGSFGNKESAGQGLATEVGAEGRELVTKGSVVLPMQPGLAESGSVSWGDNKINALEAAAANIAGSTIEGAAEGGSKAIAGLVGASKKEIKNILGGGIKTDDVAAYFAGQAVSNTGVFTRATGKVMNPNLELLFTGPNLRSFAYSYKFTPREGAEAKMIRKIIRFFKKHMAAKRTEGNLFLKSPDIFKLKYIFKGGGQHPYLNKIKPCALRSFDVQYTPDGSYMTYGDGSMTSYQVSLNFGELNPIYDKDYDGSDNDMGY